MYILIVQLTTWSKFRQAFHKNLMTIPHQEKLFFNVLEEYWDLKDYRATLGHKTNHRFNPNTQFHFAYHPRFGYTITIATKQAIKKGQEVYVDYGYAVMPQSQVPQWYAEEYERSTNQPWPGLLLGNEVDIDPSHQTIAVRKYFLEDI